MTVGRATLANAIRALSMDAVQKANSGHPGAPMGMADIAQVLWNDYLSHNPDDPAWVNRDRFVLSNGHGSMLLYSLLHLSGYSLTIDDLKNFRQLHSPTAGHPEYEECPGVETTTGPLGQGIANGVGMALAEKVLAAQFNRPGHNVVDHFTYVFLGDGCLMEGISHEVCSLAGTLGLGKLIAFYDDNGISIDGEVTGWFTDNTPQRFESYQWHVIADVDGHDPEAIAGAIEAARAQTDKPTLICCKTVIGKGSPNKAGTAGSHGAPLGVDEVAATRAQIGWDHEPFVVPEDVYAEWNFSERGQALQSEWQAGFDAYEAAHPELAAEFKRRSSGALPADWQAAASAIIADIQANGQNIASRKASQNAIEAFAKLLPEMLGGSADLAGSNLTLWSGSEGIGAEQSAGNYVYYGVREFGMSAMMNGIALHGGFIPYGATFLVFMEYARNAVRMAALMEQRSIFVYTHDSIGLGEDGPTHQPIEQLANLRATPNLATWRPADDVESAVAWKVALETQSPSALIFSRQGLPHLERSTETLANVERGAYVLKQESNALSAIVLATGSEVAIAMEAAEQLESEGLGVRVVSMPAEAVFAQQSPEYQESVLPKAETRRVSIEAGATQSWYRWVGLQGKAIGLDHFGASAPAGELYKAFGITADAVVAAVKDVAAS